MHKITVAMATLLILGCTAPSGSDTDDQSEPETIAGYEATRFSEDGIDAVRVELGDDIRVVFKANDGNSGGGIDSACLTCKISNISTCAAEVCPAVKEQNPDASCYNEIKACMERKCAGKCSGDKALIAEFFGDVSSVPLKASDQ